MSHFSLIVATKEFPSEDVLSAQLQPFHEYECTGTDDQYVIDYDVTDDERKNWQSGTVRKLRDTKGGLHCPYDDKFYREFTAGERGKLKGVLPIGSGWSAELGVSFTSKDWGDGLGYRGKVHFVPTGWEEVEVSRPSIETFKQYLVDEGFDEVLPGGRTKYKFVECEGDDVIRAVRRTNPNKQWDYWRVGGRYCRKFIPKPGAKSLRAELSCEWGMSEHKPPEGVDQIQKKDLDVEAMLNARRADRSKEFTDLVVKSGLSVSEAEAGLMNHGKIEAEWRTLPEPRPRGAEFREWAAKRCPFAGRILEKCFDLPNLGGRTVQEWIGDAPPLTCFAFLRDGVWSEKGSMGWFGCVADEKDDWQEEFQKLFDAVPGEYWLTVVDCHI